MESSTKVFVWGGAIVAILALLKYKVFATPPIADGAATTNSTTDDSTDQGGMGGGGSMPSNEAVFTPNLSALNNQANTIAPSSSSTNATSTNSAPVSTPATLNTSSISTAAPTPLIATPAGPINRRTLIEASPATIGFDGKIVYPKTLKHLFGK